MSLRKDGSPRQPRENWTDEEQAIFIRGLEEEKNTKRIIWEEFIKKYQLNRTVSQCKVSHFMRILLCRIIIVSWSQGIEIETTSNYCDIFV